MSGKLLKNLKNYATTLRLGIYFKFSYFCVIVDFMINYILIFKVLNQKFQISKKNKNKSSKYFQICLYQIKQYNFKKKQNSINSNKQIQLVWVEKTFVSSKKTHCIRH